MNAESHHDELVRFAEVIGLFYEELGLPRAWGRVLGWLLVCEPEEQSAEELSSILHASRGSISMATRSLIRTGNVERHTKRGDRRTYYRIQPGAWTTMFDHQVQTVSKLKRLAGQGLDLLKAEPDERRSRLQGLYDLTTFYERESLSLLTQWHRRNGQNNYEPSRTFNATPPA